MSHRLPRRSEQGIYWHPEDARAGVVAGAFLRCRRAADAARNDDVAGAIDGARERWWADVRRMAPHERTPQTVLAAAVAAGADYGVGSLVVGGLADSVGNEEAEAAATDYLQPVREAFQTVREQLPAFPSWSGPAELPAGPVSAEADGPLAQAKTKLGAVLGELRRRAYEYGPSWLPPTAKTRQLMETVSPGWNAAKKLAVEKYGKDIRKDPGAYADSVQEMWRFSLEMPLLLGLLEDRIKKLGTSVPPDRLLSYQRLKRRSDTLRGLFYEGCHPSTGLQEAQDEAKRLVGEDVRQEKSGGIVRAGAVPAAPAYTVATGLGVLILGGVVVGLASIAFSKRFSPVALEAQEATRREVEWVEFCTLYAASHGGAMPPADMLPPAVVLSKDPPDPDATPTGLYVAGGVAGGIALALGLWWMTSGPAEKAK